jgi:hypothetical protein
MPVRTMIASPVRISTPCADALASRSSAVMA